MVEVVGIALIVGIFLAAVALFAWEADRPRYPGGPPHSLGFWMTEQEHRDWQAGWRPMSLREADRQYTQRQNAMYERLAKSAPKKP